MNYIEQVIKLHKFNSEKIVVVDNNSKRITRAKNIEILSNKIANKILKLKVEKNMLIGINLEYSMEYIASIIGILKSGLGFLPLSINIPKDRLEFIIKDSSCKLVIDNLWIQDIEKENAEDVYIKNSDTTVAFSIYTSGSTGNPKGITHEYKNLNNIIESYSEIESKNKKILMFAPFLFIASIAIILVALYTEAEIHIVSDEIKNDLNKLDDYVNLENIDIMFLPKSLIEFFPNKYNKYLHLITGGEIISSLYREDLKITNVYTMSEVGGAISIYNVDKKYENTPVGKSQGIYPVYLLDEEGKEVENGEEGEICLKISGIRPYFNLKDKNNSLFEKNKFKDKDFLLFHTRDIGKVNSEGNIIIIGRKDTMIKINGNRVEPFEIEKAVNQFPGILKSIVKSFKDTKNKNYLALYFISTKRVSTTEIEKFLRTILPDYMIPKFFIRLDNFPINLNGKIDMESLAEPAILKQENKNLLEKISEEEKTLCSLFSKTLNIEQVSIDDDFFKLGGDSLAAMEIIAMVNFKNLNISHIYKGKTPRKILKLWLEEKENIISKENIKLFPLLPMQEYMIKYEEHFEESTMHNISCLIRLNKKVDIEKLRLSIIETLKYHPYLKNIKFIKNSEGKIFQKLEEREFNLDIENISEIEFYHIRNELVKPFKLFGEYLFRVRLFKTKISTYLHFDVHHSVFDGYSGKRLINDINSIYFDKSIPFEEKNVLDLSLENELKKMEKKEKRVSFT